MKKQLLGLLLISCQASIFAAPEHRMEEHRLTEYGEHEREVRSHQHEHENRIKRERMQREQNEQGQKKETAAVFKLFIERIKHHLKNMKLFKKMFSDASRVKTMRRLADLERATGNFEKALKLDQEVRQKYPKFVESVKDVKEAVQKAQASNDAAMDEELEKVQQEVEELIKESENIGQALSQDLNPEATRAAMEELQQLDALSEGERIDGPLQEPGTVDHAIDVSELLGESLLPEQPENMAAAESKNVENASQAQDDTLKSGDAKDNKQQEDVVKEKPKKKKKVKKKKKAAGGLQDFLSSIQGFDKKELNKKQEKAVEETVKAAEKKEPEKAAQEKQVEDLLRQIEGATNPFQEAAIRKELKRLGVEPKKRVKKKKVVKRKSAAKASSKNEAKPTHFGETWLADKAKASLRKDALKSEKIESARKQESADAEAGPKGILEGAKVKRAEANMSSDAFGTLQKAKQELQQSLDVTAQTKQGRKLVTETRKKQAGKSAKAALEELATTVEKNMKKRGLWPAPKEIFEKEFAEVVRKSEDAQTKFKSGETYSEYLEKQLEDKGAFVDFDETSNSINIDKSAQTSQQTSPSAATKIKQDYVDKLVDKAEQEGLDAMSSSDFYKFARELGLPQEIVGQKASYAKAVNERIKSKNDVAPTLSPEAAKNLSGPAPLPTPGDLPKGGGLPAPPSGLPAPKGLPKPQGLPKPPGLPVAKGLPKPPSLPRS